MLDLSHNRMPALSRGVRALTQLTTLNLSGNKLAELPSVIGALKSLQVGGGAAAPGHYTPTAVVPRHRARLSRDVPNALLFAAWSARARDHARP